MKIERDVLKAASRFYINSMYGDGQITVPKEIVKVLGFKNKEKLKLVYHKGKLIITRL